MRVVKRYVNEEVIDRAEPYESLLLDSGYQITSTSKKDFTTFTQGHRVYIGEMDKRIWHSNVTAYGLAAR
eukprot:Ihof_evm4s408 gene=Ihof_evmTU4s408